MFFRELIMSELAVEDRWSAIDQLADRMHSKGFVKASYGELVKEREREAPTALPIGSINVAIPHDGIGACLKSGIAVEILKKPVPWVEITTNNNYLDVKVVFLLSISAHYAWLKRIEEPDKDKERMRIVMEAYERSWKTYGYRRIGMWIEREYNLKINHKTVLRLMQKLNICSVARKKNPYKQMINRYGAIHTYPNILRQNFHAEKPNQKWGTDITYIRTQQGFVYLAVIKDFSDKSILGYALSRNLSIRLILNALNMASENSLSPQGGILQSDQGPQYQSALYHQLTAKYGIIPSMSRSGNCLDNAPTESFFSHLKEEWLRHVKIVDFEQAVSVVQHYIDFYNYDLIQLKTKLTPFELRRQFV